MRPLIVIAVLALAGCADPVPPASVDDAGPAPAVKPTGVWQTWYLTADGSFAPEAPGGSYVDLGWGYADWLREVPPPAWRGDAVAEALRIVEGRVVLNFEASALQTGANARPEMTAWFGTEERQVHHLFMDGPDAIDDDDRIQGQADLRLPMGGMVLAPGEEPYLGVASYYLDNDVMATMHLVVGGDDASRIEVLVEPVALPPVADPIPSMLTARLVGGRCVADLNPNSIAMASFPLDIQSAKLAQLRLLRAQGGPTSDVDMAVLNAAGDTVSRGQGPLGAEGIDLWGTNLEAAGDGAHTLVVYACTAQAADVVVTVVTFR